MVSVSGIDVKFGRILLVVVAMVALIVLYKHYGSGHLELNSKAPTTAVATPQPTTTRRVG